MGFRRLLVAAVVFSAAVILAPTGPAQACSCAAWEEGSTQEEREAKATELANAVFVGEATSSRVEDGDGDPNVSSSGDRRDVTFSVRRVTKGPVTNPFEVSTARDGAACGVNFQAGVLYKVFTGEHEGRQWVHSCGATRVATEADLIEPATTTTAPPPPATTTTRPQPTSTTTAAPPVTEPAPATTSTTARAVADDEVALDSEPTSARTPVGLSAMAVLLLLGVASATGLRTWRGRRS